MKHMQKGLLILIALSGFLFSCSYQDVNSGVPNSSTFRKRIVLSHTSMFLEVGDSEDVTAQLNYDDTQFSAFEWSSTDENIAKFQDGKIYALQEGIADIIVTYADLEENCRVTVLPIKDKSSNSGEVHMFAMNDFHGAIKNNGRELGFLKNGTFFKEKKKEKNTLIFNSGDMFQGSIYSNSNYGEFLAKSMNNIGFDCFTLGNHEFDWGQEYIQKNRKLKDEKTKYSTPYLGANIYHYDIKKHSILNQANDLADSYVIRDLHNGIRVGIIGVIGEDQISSITSNYVDDLTFTIPTGKIKELSDELRTNKKCDVVILDAHASYSQIDTSITEVSQKTKKKYIDAAFLAHSHQFEEFKYNDVPFVQGSSNGRAYSEIHLTLEEGNVVQFQYTSHENGNLETEKIVNYDEELLQLYETYTQKADDMAKENLGTLVGNLYSSTNSDLPLPNLVVKAMAQEAKKQGYKVDFAICNNARATLYEGTITYEKLYKSLPFDNELHVIQVTGDNIIRQSNYNSVYRVSKTKISSDKYYTIVVIDYLAFHRNTARYYDYFPQQKYLGKLVKKGGARYTYRDIVAEYIRKNKTINASDFSRDNESFKVF